MSLQGDLLRNRKVFEILTGDGQEREQDLSARQQASGLNLFSGVAEGQHGKAMDAGATVNADKAVSQTVPARGFSLNYGTVELPGRFTDMPEVGAVTYPEIRAETAYSTTARFDPLEPMYRRMETEARMASQLSREEGSFGF